MGSSNSSSSPSPARSKNPAADARSTVSVGAPDKLITAEGSTGVRRLVANQQYFGLEARALRAGAERVLARIAAQGPGQTHIDFCALCADFHLDSAGSWTLVSALVAGGLLHPDGSGYRLTDRFREYALACVVAPLSRARAKALIQTAGELAASINADWPRNPFQVKMIAVSGSFMSRRDPLPELSLWVVLRPRPEARARRLRSLLNKGDGLRQILTAVNGISSFIVVRIVAHRQDVQRPFSVVFQASEDMVDISVPAWDRVRGWGASLTHRLASR